jgi:hypothetical protein
MGVAERDVGDGDMGFDVAVAEAGAGVGDGDAGVGERGPANAAEEVDLEVQKIFDAEVQGDGAGGGEFAGFGALAIAEMHGVGVGVASGECGGDTAVHAAGEADDGAGFELEGRAHPDYGTAGIAGGCRMLSMRRVLARVAGG